jgi:hypothetical protein
MKTVFWCAAVVVAFGLSASAARQVISAKKSGLYLTGADFQQGRLAYEGDCGSKAHKLELHDVLHKSYIHVTHEGGRKRFEKTDLFGFRSCDARDYRFVLNVEYQILEAKELYIYRREVLVSHGRGSHGVKKFFFSVGPDGEVRELTLANLKQAFPENSVFRHSLDEAVGAGQKLSDYEEAHKTFMVNRLLSASREEHP